MESVSETSVSPKCATPRSAHMDTKLVSPPPMSFLFYHHRSGVSADADARSRCFRRFLGLLPLFSGRRSYFYNGGAAKKFYDVLYFFLGPLHLFVYLL